MRPPIMVTFLLKNLKQQQHNKQAKKPNKRAGLFKQIEEK